MEVRRTEDEKNEKMREHILLLGCGRALTKSKGKLIETLQLCHKGTHGVPCLFLELQVTGVLDGL